MEDLVPLPGDRFSSTPHKGGSQGHPEPQSNQWGMGPCSSVCAWVVWPSECLGAVRPPVADTENCSLCPLSPQHQRLLPPKPFSELPGPSGNLPDLFLLPVPQAPSVTGQPGPGHGKKLGHRGVDASGETTYKKVAGGPSWVAREVGTIADRQALQVTRCCVLPTMAVATHTVR